MEDTNGLANGANGTHTPDEPQTPTTPPRPKHTTLALTEYTAAASPISTTPRERARAILPEHLLLPNGHPDVRIFFLPGVQAEHHVRSTWTHCVFIC